MTQGDFLVGAFGIGGQIFDREEAQVFLSSEDSDNFRRNLVSVLCEERLARTVQRPEAFVYGSSSITSGKKRDRGRCWVGRPPRPGWALARLRPAFAADRRGEGMGRRGGLDGSPRRSYPLILTSAA
jgi:hypothetical protein